MARRLLRVAVSLAVLVVATFARDHLIPGDPVRAALGTSAPPEVIDARRAALGLDEPLAEQFVGHVAGLVRGDLGTSLISGVDVSETLRERLPETATLVLLAFLVILAVAVPVGLLLAVLTRDGRRRRVETGFATVTGVLVTVPDFVVATVLVFVFGLTLAWLPVAGAGGPSSFVLPVAALAIGPAAALSRIVRVDTLRVLAEDYLRVAATKQLPTRRFLLRHALPNVLTSTLTLGGLLLGGLLAGTVVIETIFAWPGLGSAVVQSILERDYPLVQGLALVLGAAVLLINLVVDLVLIAVDPRSTLAEH